MKEKGISIHLIEMHCKFLDPLYENLILNFMQNEKIMKMIYIQRKK